MSKYLIAKFSLGLPKHQLSVIVLRIPGCYSANRGQESALVGLIDGLHFHLEFKLKHCLFSRGQFPNGYGRIDQT